MEQFIYKFHVGITFFSDDSGKLAEKKSERSENKSNLLSFDYQHHGCFKSMLQQISETK